MVSRIEAEADVELAAAVRQLAERATQYSDEKMLEIIAEVGQIASAAARLEELTGRANAVGEVAVQASLEPGARGVIIAESSQVKIQPAETATDEPETALDEIADDSDEAVAPAEDASELLKALGLRSKRYLPVLEQLVTNPGKSYSPKDLRQLVDTGTDLGNRQMVTKLMNTIKTSPYADNLHASGKTSSRLYSWNSELAQTSGAELDVPEVSEATKPALSGLYQSETFISQGYDEYDDDLEIEPEDVEMPPVESVEDNRPSPTMMPARMPTHPVTPLNKKHFGSFHNLSIVSDEPELVEENAETVPEEPAIEPEKEDELSARLRDLNIDYNEYGVKINGVYLDAPSRVTTLLADIASYKKGITFEELAKGIKYDEKDKYAKINVGKQLSADINTLKTILADFADQLVFSDETYVKAQHGHDKRERLLTVLRPDEVRERKQSPEPESDEDEDDESFLA